MCHNQLRHRPTAGCEKHHPLLLLLLLLPLLLLLLLLLLPTLDAAFA
jgi:hypothetical protein